LSLFTAKQMPSAVISTRPPTHSPSKAFESKEAAWGTDSADFDADAWDRMRWHLWRYARLVLLNLSFAGIGHRHHSP
jgi:hypothetical protein